MLTFDQMVAYKLLTLPLLMLIGGIFILMTSGFFIGKDKRIDSPTFLALIIGTALTCIAVYVIIEGSLTTVAITPCSISGNFVAVTNEDIYYAEDSVMVKLHLNQTRDVVVLHTPMRENSEIIDVKSKIYPDSAGTGC